MEASKSCHFVWYSPITFLTYPRVSLQGGTSLYLSTAPSPAFQAATGSEFLGKWQNVKKKWDAVEIVKIGDDFAMLSKDKDFFTGKMVTTKIPFQLKDDTLVLEAGVMSARMTHEQATDTLSRKTAFSIEEYKRVK